MFQQRGRADFQEDLARPIYSTLFFVLFLFATSECFAEQLLPLTIERLEEEKKALSGDIRDVYGEAKANGFDVRIMRKIVSIRKQDRDSRIEEETTLDLYLAALGMN